MKQILHLRYLCLAVVLLMSTAGQAHQRSPFAYHFVVTPEEGQHDPSIEQRYSARFRQCQDRAVSTLGNEACFTVELALQDRRLNRVWRTTLIKIEPLLRGRLLAAQEKWPPKRDRFCNSKANELLGGTIVPLIYMDCRVEQDIRRMIWLEKLR